MKFDRRTPVGAGLSEAAERLLATSGAPLSCRSSAIDVWLRHHPRYRPVTVTAELGDELVGVAPLARLRRPGWSMITRAGSTDEVGWLGIRDDASAPALADAVAERLARLRGPWMLRLDGMPDRHPVTAALLERVPRMQLSERIPWPRWSLTPATSEADILTRNQRRALAKAYNRIAHTDLKLTMAWHRDPDEIDRLLPEILDLHRRRNRQRRGQAQLDEPAAAAYFLDVVRSNAHLGRALLLTTRLDARLGAFALAFADRTSSYDALYVYANLADPESLHYSPGAIANAEVVRYAVENRFGWIDWGLGAQRYKTSNSNRVDEVVTLSAASHGLVGALERQGGRLRPALAHLRRP